MKQNRITSATVQPTANFTGNKAHQTQAQTPESVKDPEVDQPDNRQPAARQQSDTGNHGEAFVIDPGQANDATGEPIAIGDIVAELNDPGHGGKVVAIAAKWIVYRDVDGQCDIGMANECRIVHHRAPRDEKKSQGESHIPGPNNWQSHPAAKADRSTGRILVAWPEERDMKLARIAGEFAPVNDEECRQTLAKLDRFEMALHHMDWAWNSIGPHGGESIYFADAIQAEIVNQIIRTLCDEFTNTAWGVRSWIAGYLNGDLKYDSPEQQRENAEAISAVV